MKKDLRLFAFLAFMGTLLFVVMVVTLHFLEPDLNPLQQTASQYVNGPYGILMTVAFAGLAFSSFALLAGLYQGIAPPARSRTGFILFSIWAVGILVAMTFHVNPEGTPLTTPGLIHRVDGPIAFPCATVAIILLSRSFRKDERWHASYKTARLLSWLLPGLVLATFVLLTTHAGYTGLCQRLLLTVLVLWYLVVVRRLYVISRKQGK